MPVGIFEHHPFLDYYVNYNQGGLSVSRYESLIIGSFPVQALTLPAPNAAPRPQGQQQGRFRFFYGSGTADDHNLFWDYFLSAYDRNDLLNPVQPGVESALTGVLEEQGYLITDVLSVTDRHDESPLDASLMKTPAGCQLNLEVFDFLFECPRLRYLYFTALPGAGKSPWTWFKAILSARGAHLTTVAVSRLVKKLTVRYRGQIREFTAFFLFSPASYRGVQLGRDRRHPAFLSYLQARYPDFVGLIPPLGEELSPALKKQLTPIRKQFLTHLYAEFFVKKNMLFP